MQDSRPILVTILCILHWVALGFGILLIILVLAFNGLGKYENLIDNLVTNTPEFNDTFYDSELLKDKDTFYENKAGEKLIDSIGILADSTRTSSYNIEKTMRDLNSFSNGINKTIHILVRAARVFFPICIGLFAIWLIAIWFIWLMKKLGLILYSTVSVLFLGTYVYLFYPLLNTGFIGALYFGAYIFFIFIGLVLFNILFYLKYKKFT